MGSVSRCTVAFGLAWLAPALAAGDPPLFPADTSPGAGQALFLSAVDFDLDGAPDAVATVQAKVLAWRGTGSGTFEPAIESAALSQAGFQSALADFDGDGRLDVAVSRLPPVGVPPDMLQVLAGDGAGHFAPLSTASLPAPAVSLVALDVDLDGNLDLAATQMLDEGSVVLWLWNAGDGSFLFGSSSDTVAWPLERMRAGDLDEDGAHDLVASADTRLARFLNVGGGFSLQPLINLPHVVGELRLADVVEDGHLDVVAGSNFATLQPLWVLEGAGNGGFGAPLATGDLASSTRSFELTDLDADGHLDVAMVNDFADSLATFLGDGLGAFALEKHWLPGTARGVAVADADGDGKLDLLTTSAAANFADLTFWRGAGTGDFAAPGFINILATTDRMALASLDADSDVDVVLTSSGYDKLFVLRGQGSGQFGLSDSVDASSMDPREPVVADLDEDGALDVVFSAAKETASASYVLGNGDGTLETTLHALGSGTWGVAAADLDGDGHQDVLTTSSSESFNGPRGLRTFRGNGAGSFVALPVKNSGKRMGGVAATDLDLDGDLDVVATSFSDGGGVVRYLNAGGLGAGAQTAVADMPSEVCAADLDADGTPDLLLAHIAWPQAVHGLTVMAGDGAGGLSQAWSGAEGHSVSSARVADMDGDGVLDLVAARQVNGDVAVFGGDGNLSFAPLFAARMGKVPLDVLVFDANEDGRADLLCTDSSTTGLCLSLQLAPPTWVKQGHGLSGADGVPALSGIGTLAAGSPIALRVKEAAPLAATTLVVGLSELLASFKGGTLVPSVDLLVMGLVTDVDGALLLATNMPPGLPSGVELSFQAWIADAGGPKGFAATNGLRATTP